MQKLSYQQQSIAGMNGVELIVALYDGMVRFLNHAIAATEAGNIRDRRIAIKRVLDILMHLQSRLRMDVGGPARTLSEFYASIFALCLEGSRLASPQKFREAIQCILNVREAWQQVAQDPEVRRQFANPNAPRVSAPVQTHREIAQPQSTGWTA
jgi:flagellar secretion chaperone FliS